MYGAVIGDIVGAPFEFDRGDKTKTFELFTEESRFTDDSVMTIAVESALLAHDSDETDDNLERAFVTSMKTYGKKYINAGYGGMFFRWLLSPFPKPYGSFGNGSAMRVSSVGWLYDDISETRRMAYLSAVVTHNHPEGIKGAEAVASAIFLARHGSANPEIKKYLESEFSYDLNRSCDEIRPNYSMDATCQGSVPEAIIAFLEGLNYEDCIRNAVSLGGDTDTLACIAGGMAEARYGVPKELVYEAKKRIPNEMIDVMDKMYTRLGKDI